MFSIIDCVHNYLNPDVVNVLVESTGAMKSYKYDRMEVARLQ